MHNEKMTPEQALELWRSLEGKTNRAKTLSPDVLTLVALGLLDEARTLAVPRG